MNEMRYARDLFTPQNPMSRVKEVLEKLGAVHGCKSIDCRQCPFHNLHLGDKERCQTQMIEHLPAFIKVAEDWLEKHKCRCAHCTCGKEKL